MELATHNTMSYRKPKQFWINTYKDSDCTLVVDFINIQEKSL